MPTYDYYCQVCEKRVSVYQSYGDYGRVPARCPHCESKDLRRLINRVRFARSEESRLASLTDPSEWGKFDQDDPRAMARMMRKMGNELGEEMPSEFEEVVDRLEAGQSPEDIEKSMPDLGAMADDLEG